MAKPKLKPGDRMPQFTLPDQDGRPVASQSLLKTGGLVLFFYPKDNTGGCTREACAFRDAYADIKDLGAEVVGISRDDAASHQDFRQRQNLPYTLLSDTTGKVHDLFGVGKRFFILRDRVTFVINAQGIITQVFQSVVEFSRHAEEALRALESDAKK